MQYIPGSSVTLSATLSYLQRNQPLPDDSEVQTHIPQICVDYLSHEWQEEDVWKSWRNMTRHKSEITNGVRLENASWRTWWKQRNKLKTVSPETLNWLKDSDVTWLYGPLHTAAEPVPPPKQSTAEERLNLVKATGKKPILKHRTITELLNLHAHEHGHAAVPAPIGSPALEAVGLASPVEGGSRTGSPRPTLPHTKSDSQIVRIGSASGKDSPPRVTLMDPPAGDPSASRSLSPAGSEGLAGSVSNLSLNTAPAKRHISFNTFVEQCISIEDPSAEKRTPARGAFYDSDDEAVYDDDDDEDDEESSASSILEMHPTQVVGSRRPNERGTTPVLRSNSTSQERERMTIAPIPPTVLKAAEDLPAPSPQVIYAPPKEFLWDQNDFASSASSSGESTSSSDTLSSASGSITGQNVDMGFVAPQWGRPPAAPGTVGKGSTGPVGPTGVFQSDPYAATGYEEPAKPDLTQPSSAVATAPGPTHLGLHAGRTKWVPGSEIPDDEDEAEEDSGDEAAENSTTGDEDDEDETPAAGRDLGTTNASSSVSGSTTSSSANRTVIAGSPPVVVGSPPSTVRSTSSRGSSSQQPARGILKKNTGSVGGSVNGGDDTNSSSGIARHSNPIGIPKTSISHPPPSSAMHMPPTATMSTSSPPSSNMLASAGFLSPSQESVIFFGGGNGPSPGGRGRTSTRSASSSGISDRSRSSSKISGTSSPLGSVSPSGYGSPSGSRASSVLGNRRSSTDVGVAVASGRSIRRENGNGGVSARQSSTSPPVVSSPLATNPLNASSLGTIVANVPMDSVVAPERGGPPLSRSGIIAGARIASTSRPKMGSRASSSSSVTSTASSGSSSETANAMRTPRENVKMVLPAAPAAAVSAPLPVEAVKKPATSSLVLPEGPRPTVIISPQSSAAPSAQSSGSRESPSAGTSMSMDARDSKLEEEMRKVKAAQAAAKSAAAAAPPAPAEPAKTKQGDVSDPEEVESGTFQEYKSTVPTPSNSPIMGLSKALGSSKQQPQPNSDSVTSSVPPTPQSPPPSAASSVSPASTPKRATFPSTVSPGTAVITPPSASAPALTPTEESGIVGMAANSLVSSAKGMLGAIWSLGGEGVKQ